ncbi:hypothetical protein C8Q77DRAFT_140391 [Trametes polyzona]|nr:hypothetical protein C8Q77DRAFT_140391 [Trametes polyzona]
MIMMELCLTQRSMPYYSDCSWFLVGTKCSHERPSTTLGRRPVRPDRIGREYKYYECDRTTHARMELHRRDSIRPTLMWLTYGRMDPIGAVVTTISCATRADAMRTKCTTSDVALRAPGWTELQLRHTARYVGDNFDGIERLLCYDGIPQCHGCYLHPRRILSASSPPGPLKDVIRNAKAQCSPWDTTSHPWSLGEPPVLEIALHIQSRPFPSSACDLGAVTSSRIQVRVPGRARITGLPRVAQACDV